jgi:drug/metabolite transporter (DMT)-like permease
VTTRAAAVPPTATAAPEWQVWTALWIIYIVWGSTYFAIAVIVDTLPPMLIGGFRFTIAGLVLVGVIAARSGLEPFRAIGRRELIGAAIVGCLLSTGGNGLVMVGEQYIASGLAALIVAAVPMWVVLFRWRTGDRVASKTLIGVAFGFVGVGLLLLPGGGGHAEPLGFFFVLMASLCWSTGTFLGSKISLPSSPVVSTGVQMTIGGLLGIVIGLAIGEGGQIHSDALETDAIIAFVYLIVVGSLLAYTTYSWLLQNAPVSKVATYAYVNPVIAILLGSLFRDETITLTIIAGAGLIIGAVAIVVRTESGRAREPAPTREG